MLITYILLTVVKILDNIISTAKSILQYRGAKVISSILVMVSQLLFYLIISKVVEDNSILTIIIISIASGIGNLIAFPILEKCKRDDKWQYHLTSSDKEDVLRLCDYLVEHKIKYLANHGIDINGKDTINVIAYSKTKNESRLIDDYLNKSNSKYLKEVNR